MKQDQESQEQRHHQGIDMDKWNQMCIKINWNPQFKLSLLPILWSINNKILALNGLRAISNYYNVELFWCLGFSGGYGYGGPVYGGYGGGHYNNYYGGKNQ